MSELFGVNWTKKFTDIWEDGTTFSEEVIESEIGITGVSAQQLARIYYLLYARYGNSCITNFDENQWKYKVFALLYQYAPIYIKELDIQTKLLNLSDEDLFKGTQAIYNHSFNPSTEPSTSTLNELTTIDDQNTTNYKKSKMDAYTQLLDLLDTDVTKRFLDRFKNLFISIVEPQEPLLYEEI